MYGNKAMEAQRRKNFAVGSDNTEILGRSVCWGHGGIKINN